MNTRYKNFRNNPFVSEIADIKKWTVSTNRKIPIDMYLLKYRNIIKGALFTDDLSLTTLDGVNELIPDAANYTFYLDALIENFCVFDIEPTCPAEIKAKLMKMPCLYCETSMSGKGIHMVFRLPENILDEYPAAKQKIVFKEEHGYYELLLNHYVTFTANQISANIGEDDGSFKKLFTEMAAEQKETVRADIEMIELETVNTERASDILDLLIGHAGDYKKTLADFHGDYSKYEFGYTASLMRKLEKVLKGRPVKAENHEYTDSEKAWFLYKATSKTLPKRPKHEEFRNGMPWLLYLAFDVIARSKPVDEEMKSND